jgi:hypothetical protein
VKLTNILHPMLLVPVSRTATTAGTDPTVWTYLETNTLLFLSHLSWLSSTQTLCQHVRSLPEPWLFFVFLPLGHLSLKTIGSLSRCSLLCFLRLVEQQCLSFKNYYAYILF